MTLQGDCDGETFVRELDGIRLTGQRLRVYACMRDGHWRTLGELRLVTGGSEAALSARLRDFRKPEFGSHTLERRRRGDPKAGLHEYRLVIRQMVLL